MNFRETDLKDLFVVETDFISDERGHFFRSFCKNEFAQIGHSDEFVQINQSFNKKKGTFRGFHYQKPPFKEVKVVSCIAGKVIDIVVDVRKNSATFLKNFQIELSEQNGKMIYIPKGFAHGFITLEENSKMLYYHSSVYKPNYESGLRYNDPLLNINLPYKIDNISDRDKNISLLNDQFEGI